MLTRHQETPPGGRTADRYPRAASLPDQRGESLTHDSIPAEHTFSAVAEVAVDPRTARVYEHGWQTGSPTTSYPVSSRPHRPLSENFQVMRFRPGPPAPPDVFQGEGLLAVRPHAGGAPVHVFAGRPGADRLPSIRAQVAHGRVIVTADGAVDHVVDELPGGLTGALGRWADGYAAGAGVAEIRPAPTLWCSWYYYWTGVTEDDVLDNLTAIDEYELPVDVVQLDDGYQAELGDWLSLSGRFTSLSDLATRIRDRGRRAGIWTAPLLVGARSRLYAEHPDWLVSGISAGWHWDQDLFALDVTHPDAASYLHQVFTTFRGYGFDFFKIDFMYAGALTGRRHVDVSGVEAYRRGLHLIRDAIGPESYLLGCGAPILPSVGLVDAMRVSPDIGPQYEPPVEDLSEPSQRAATLTGAARAWQHGRFWVNDPDCLLARPEMERREEWALHVERFGGLRASSDRIRGLDTWGLDTTRRLLSTVPPPVPFALDDESGTNRPTDPSADEMGAG